MPNYTSDDVRKVAERLRSARDRERPAHFLIGAGCSISANIPGAAELVKKIHKDYPEHCRDLSQDAAPSYGTCMALLSSNERRDLIKPYLQDAKINWGHIALAQLIHEGFIGRIHTLNFDMVLENACGLLGFQPAVYDFGVAPGADPAMLVSPAIVHLHGQSYGLVLLNTADETRRHRDKLRPILTDSLRNAPLIVIGYSGSADGVFQGLQDEFEGREALYWVGYDEEPRAHIAPLVTKAHARYLGGADFDRFMIELTQALACWPPRLFSNPINHLLAQIGPVVAYPVGQAHSEVDLLADLRAKLDRLSGDFQEAPRGFTRVQEAFVRGAYTDAVEAYRQLSDGEKARLESQQQDVSAWSFIEVGNLLVDQAEHATGDEAARLFADAADKYRHALAIKPDMHEALNNWGNLLVDQAKHATGDEAARLLADAADKYRQALASKPDMHEALNNWGILLSNQARHATGDEAARLLADAADKYRQALASKPGKHEALFNWGSLLREQAKHATGDEAARLLDDAADKYRQALAIKPDKHEALNNWGSLLREQAKHATGDEAARLLDDAADKYRQALAIKPDKHEALNNWGSLLREQAKHATGDEAARLLDDAADKYRQALAIKPDDHETLSNWGILLLKQARRATGDEAARLLADAADKYRQALAIKPDKHEALSNWGNLLEEQAKHATGDEAARLLDDAADKYRQALAIKPDDRETLSNWGILLSDQARRATGDEAARLFDEAEAKLRAALQKEPRKVYNLACLRALQGRADECRDLLVRGETFGTLPSATHMREDPDFESIRDEAWFLELLARLDT